MFEPAVASVAPKSPRLSGELMACPITVMRFPFRPDSA